MAYIYLDQQEEKLHFFKRITYEKGFSSFKMVLSEHVPPQYTNSKFSILYIWDSSAFRSMHEDNIRHMDSLSKSFGNQFNYILLTEMDEQASISFLNRRSIPINNLKVMGNMDDYISSIYGNKLINYTSGIKDNGDVNFSRLKLKPFYLIINSEGKIMYFSYKQLSLGANKDFSGTLKSISSKTYTRTIN